MSLIVSVFLFFSGIYSAHAGAGNPWTYNGTLGPAHWHIDYPNCGGKKQSPINIVTDDLEYGEHLLPFDLNDLAKVDGVNMTLENVEGHTVEVVFSGETDMLVTGGGLSGSYQVKQFHFHWGQKDERGSEHDINNKRFPMEMHIVLYSTKYDDISKAVDQPEGLAVLAFLFQVGEANSDFDHILSFFEAIQHSGNETAIPTFPLKSLLPENTDTFFRYAGSLTTPPCYESVVWTVFTNHITLSEDQLEKFRHIKRNRVGTDDVNLVDDFRPLQEINHRKVFTNDLSLTSGQVMKSLAVPLVFMCILVSLFVS